VNGETRGAPLEARMQESQQPSGLRWSSELVLPTTFSTPSPYPCCTYVFVVVCP